MLPEAESLLASPSSSSKRQLLDADEILKKEQLRMTSLFIQVMQFAFIVLYGVFTTPESYIDKDKTRNFNSGYSMFTGVLIMMLVGFGYLMTFISHYELGSVAFCILVTAVAFQWSLFTEAFFGMMWSRSFEYISLDIYNLINSLYATAAVLISFGAVIGNTNPTQLLVMTLFELVFYSLNNQIFQLKLLKIADCGGTIIIHMFGAYYGLAVSYMLGPPKIEVRETYTADVFSFVGTVFLWIYWPSFVAGELESGSLEQQRAISNTVLCLLGSTITAFSASIIYSSDGRFRPADIQNATLAGGVAIGAIANLTLYPWMVLLLGVIVGQTATYGFARLHYILEHRIGIHDSAGIHNLHGMPSLIGGLVSVLVAAWKTSGDISATDGAVYANHLQLQPGFQMAGVIVTISIAISSGVFTGLIIRNIAQYPYKRMYDVAFWQANYYEGPSKHHK